MGVAIKYNDICICLPKPNRHHNCIWYAAEVLKLKTPIGNPGSSQGFYLNDGTFLNRQDALEYAIKNDQLINKQAHHDLYSEDLW